MTAKLLTIALIFLLQTMACGDRQAAENSAVVKVYKDCVDYNWTMSAEAVDAETNGEKSGGGHFTSKLDGSFMTFDYENFDSTGAASDEFNKKVRAVGKVLRNSKLKDKDGREIGEKIVVKNAQDGQYQLYWTNSRKLYTITGETEAAIAYVEGLCGF